MAVFADTKTVVETPSWHMIEQYELWLIKTDSSDNTLWKQILGIKDQYAASRQYSLVQTRDGGYAIGGGTSSDVWWLIKTDSAGSVQWEKTYRYSDDENSYDKFGFWFSMVQLWTEDSPWLAPHLCIALAKAGISA